MTESGAQEIQWPARSGHDVILIGAGHNGTRAHFLRTFEQARSPRLGEPLPEIVHAAWAGRYLEELDVDVIHDHTLTGPLAARDRKAPTVVTAHGPVTGEIGTCLMFPVCWDEPFGMVMIEAMACGTPVVALNRGSVPEVVADGVTGFILDDPAPGLTDQ